MLKRLIPAVGPNRMGTPSLTAVWEKCDNVVTMLLDIASNSRCVLPEKMLRRRVRRWVPMEPNSLECTWRKQIMSLTWKYRQRQHFLACQKKMPSLPKNTVNDIYHRGLEQCCAQLGAAPKISSLVLHVRSKIPPRRKYFHKAKK